MDNDVYALIYTSRAKSAISDDELLKILKVSRKNNTIANITGVLLYRNQHFIQLLEGPEEAVNRIYDTIKQDERHHHIQLVYSGSKENRQYEGWTMGFVHMEQYQLGAGFNDFIDQYLVKEHLVEAGDSLYHFVGTLKEHAQTDS